MFVKERGTFVINEEIMWKKGLLIIAIPHKERARFSGGNYTIIRNK